MIKRGTSKIHRLFSVIHSSNTYDRNAEVGTSSGPSPAHAMGQNSEVNMQLLLKLSDVLEAPESRKALNGLQGDEAQLMVNFLNSVLLEPTFPTTWLRKHSLIALYKLSKLSRVYPHCYILKDITFGSYESGGGFSDVHKGRFGEQDLCLKVVRLHQKSDTETMLKIYAKEAILWSQLHHPNITPFYGIYYLNEERKQVCLVSPWMHKGNLVDYLKHNPSVSRPPFVYDIATGLEYLHDQDLIHGDIKGMNILVNYSERACITDFGLSFIRTDHTLAYSIVATTTRGLSYRWAAPELLEDGAHATSASDVWAFGCVCYEVLTGLLPFHGLTDPQVFRKLMRGELPAQPPDLDEGESIVWELVDCCWNMEPADRPTCQDISQELKQKGLAREQVDDLEGSMAQERQTFLGAMREREEVPIDLGRVERILNEFTKQDQSDQKTPQNRGPTVPPTNTQSGHDTELCTLLHQEADATLHEVAKKALRKAIWQRVKQLGIEHDAESIELYRNSYCDHNPSPHLLNAQLDSDPVSRSRRSHHAGGDNEGSKFANENEIWPTTNGNTSTGPKRPLSPILHEEYEAEEGHAVAPRQHFNDQRQLFNDQQQLPPWQKVHQRLLTWATNWPMSEINSALISTTRGTQVDETALSIWVTQTYKRYIRVRLTGNPPGIVDRMYVPPNVAEMVSSAVFRGWHADASEMLRDFWDSFGLHGRPRLIVALAKHRLDPDHWVVHLFSLPDGTLTTYDAAQKRSGLSDGRPLGWWSAIRIAWPDPSYPSSELLAQKMVRPYRPTQRAVDNAVAAGTISQNLLMGSRAERDPDLDRLRELINLEVKKLCQRKTLRKLSVGTEGQRPNYGETRN